MEWSERKPRENEVHVSIISPERRINHNLMIAIKSFKNVVKFNNKSKLFSQRKSRVVKI
jgi:hypothetical protein